MLKYVCVLHRLQRSGRWAKEVHRAGRNSYPRAGARVACRSRSRSGPCASPPLGARLGPGRPALQTRGPVPRIQTITRTAVVSRQSHRSHRNCQNYPIGSYSITIILCPISDLHLARVAAPSRVGRDPTRVAYTAVRDPKKSRTGKRGPSSTWRVGGARATARPRAHLRLLSHLWARALPAPPRQNATRGAARKPKQPSADTPHGCYSLPPQPTPPWPLPPARIL